MHMICTKAENEFALIAKDNARIVDLPFCGEDRDVCQKWDTTPTR